MAGRARKDAPRGRTSGRKSPADAGGAPVLNLRDVDGRWASLQEIHDELRYGRSDKQQQALFGRLRCIKQACEMADSEAETLRVEEVREQLEIVKRLRSQGTGALLTSKNTPSLPVSGSGNTH